MNLVLGLIVTSVSGVLVWSGITDPEGGTWAGLGRLIRGETQPDKAAPSSFLTSVAALTSAGNTGGGGSKPAPSTPAPAAPSTGKTPRSIYNLGPVKPHVAKAANLLGPMFGITSVGGYRASATDPNGHPAGRALDFMVSDARGSALAAYALANRRRLRVEYVIWRQRINSGTGWRPMADRGSPTQNHMDHVHINFTA